MPNRRRDAGATAEVQESAARWQLELVPLARIPLGTLLCACVWNGAE
jgi:hypothetical protein